MQSKCRVLKLLTFSPKILCVSTLQSRVCGDTTLQSTPCKKTPCMCAEALLCRVPNWKLPTLKIRHTPQYRVTSGPQNSTQASLTQRGDLSTLSSSFKSEASRDNACFYIPKVYHITKWLIDWFYSPKKIIYIHFIHTCILASHSY